VQLIITPEPGEWMLWDWLDPSRCVAVAAGPAGCFCLAVGCVPLAVAPVVRVSLLSTHATELLNLCTCIPCPCSVEYSTAVSDRPGDQPAAEVSPTTLTCPTGSCLAVTEASWGAGFTCGVDVLDRCAAACNGQQSCVLLPESDGDASFAPPDSGAWASMGPVEPCAGTSKALDVVYG
jgi:hypothetical protein